MIQFDEHFFQMGWFNHQLVLFFWIYKHVQVVFLLGDSEGTFWSVIVGWYGSLTIIQLKLFWCVLSWCQERSCSVAVRVFENYLVMPCLYQRPISRGGVMKGRCLSRSRTIQTSTCGFMCRYRLRSPRKSVVHHLAAKMEGENPEKQRLLIWITQLIDFMQWDEQFYLVQSSATIYFLRYLFNVSMG